MKKPKINLRELEVLIKIHRAEPLDKALRADRLQLYTKGLVCFTDKWELTRDGKQIARHLTGKV